MTQHFSFINKERRKIMKYYLFNAKNNDFIMKCTEAEFEALKKDYPMQIVHEMYDTGCDAYGNEFSYVNVSVIFL